MFIAKMKNRKTRDCNFEGGVIMDNTKYKIEELERQIGELWIEANRTSNTTKFQELMDRVGEKRKKIMQLKGE